MTKTGSLASPPRVFFNALESLRGIAALAVAFYHINWVNLTYHWGVVRNAYLMVDFFFVLSGFVICHGYAQKLQTGRDFGRYVWLRFGRLYPLQLAVLLAWLGSLVPVIAREIIISNGGASPALAHVRYWEILSSLALTQGLGFHSELIYNYPSWSVSTEFYTCVLFGAVVLLVGRRRPLWRVAALISFAALCAYLLVGERSYTAIYDFGMLRSILGFFFGVVVYCIYLHVRLRLAQAASGLLYSVVLATVLGTTLAFLSVKSAGYSDFALTPLVGLVVLLVAGAPLNPVTRLLSWRPLAWLGRVSYSIYMVHALVILIAGRGLSELLQAAPQLGAPPDASGWPLQPSIAAGTVFAMLTIGAICVISQYSYAYIEHPFREKSKLLAARWFPAGDAAALKTNGAKVGSGRA